jgi:hypothetical protein
MEPPSWEIRPDIKAFAALRNEFRKFLARERMARVSECRQAKSDIVHPPSFRFSGNFPDEDGGRRRYGMA